MSDRTTEIETFLGASGLSGAARHPVQSDASDRRYLRLTAEDGFSAILMDAPPDTCGSQDRFVSVARFLRSLNLSAPEIFAVDIDLGLILTEDFGDRLFSIEASASAAREKLLYEGAIKALAVLNQPPMPDLATPDATALAAMVQPAFDHYCPAAGKPATKDQAAEIYDRLANALQEIIDPAEAVTALRDFHAGNLIWLPDRTGAARAGLLDFQDALAIHPAYDLVSLLQDARRDLAPGLEAHLVAHYAAMVSAEPGAFEAAYRSLGLQRHLRILGIFVRLARQRGKPEYLRHIPRTWAHLMADLEHPALYALRRPLLAALPAPDSDVMARLEAAA